MIDKRVADVIRTTASEVGAPANVVEAVLAGVLPSIRLVAQHPKAGEEERIGGCRIGGAPDLPLGVEWPRLPPNPESAADPAAPPGAPLAFLLQVDLAEAAFADVEQLLPKRGMLYFFFYLDEDGADDVPAVLFSQDTELRRTTVPSDLPEHQLYRSFALVPCLEWTVPAPYDLGVNENLELWDELEDMVAAVQGHRSLADDRSGFAVHQLLGHGQFIQHSGTGEGERLLLQVSTDAGLSEAGYPESGIGRTWHDWGRIYYLIGEEALKSCRFAEAYVHVECC